ncbi:ATP-binding cassette domain-containing protein [Streptomyces sp. CG1]|uniref:ATP-binding cassette domain-containing protein n=1 Tax=Streptomyces sp. CG1 TaxID=1287523 RepID=UPI0034E2CAD5
MLKVRGLTRTFPVHTGGIVRRRTGTVYAVDGVDLDIRRGETPALVGESGSGSGKSTTLFELLELAAPEGGTVELFGQRLGTFTNERARELRRRIQIALQDPMASLGPGCPSATSSPSHRGPRVPTRRPSRAGCPNSLPRSGSNRGQADRFPHGFSGGQRQRVGIARALSVGPELLVLEEPVSALDVSVQAEVLELLRRLKRERGLA